MQATLMDEDEVARLRVAVLRLARHMRTLSTTEGLTPAYSGLLATLGRRGPMRVSELAAVESLHPTMLSRMLGSLESSGLVSRSPDPDDRRATWVSATRTGTRLIERLRRRQFAALTAHLDALDPSHYAALHAALPALEVLVGSAVDDSRVLLR
jgi:DNA-binding MarR family transcriptional regulator